MAKESEKITRVDVRIPHDIYAQIEAIASETNQPVHHRSGKPVVTPIILNLINLGLEQIAKEDFNLESLTDKQSGTNRIKEAEIEKKILTSIEEKLEVLIENKVSEIINDKLSDKLSNAFVVDSAEARKDNYYFEQIEEGEENLENIKLEVLPDSTKDNLSDEKSAPETPTSLNQTELAKRLGYKNHTQVGKKFKQLSKKDFIQWCKEKDPENYGWYKVGNRFEIIH